MNNLVKAYDHYTGKYNLYEKYLTNFCEECNRIVTLSSFSYCDTCKVSLCMDCLINGCPYEFN